MAQLGVVVVGIGIAGKVRCRDIGQSAQYVSAFPELEGVQLKGYCSRRDCEVEGVAKLNFEDVLEQPEVHCLTICTENGTHVEFARKALEAKKHVIVEFPIALNNNDVKELFQLAQSNGVTLQEENIMLLTDHMKKVLATSKEKSVKRGKMASSGRITRSSQSMVEGGPIFGHRTHFLHCLLLAFGSLQPVSASVTLKNISEGHSDLDAKATLRTKDNALVEIDLKFSSGPNIGWSSSYEFEFTDGTVLTNPPFERPKPPQPPVPGLFMKDFISFIGSMRGSGETYLPPDISIEALRLADELEKIATRTSS